VAFVRFSSTKHESFEELDKKWTSFFHETDDVSELRRGLETAFEDDLVPSPECITAALRAARRLNDYTLAVRALEALHYKVPSPKDYQAYLTELKPVIDELGVDQPENLK